MAKKNSNPFSEENTKEVNNMEETNNALPTGMVGVDGGATPGFMPGDANPLPGDSSPFGTPESPKFSMDFSNVDLSNTIPEGAYEAILIDVSKGTSKSGNDMWTWVFALSKGQYSGKEFKVFTAITPAALWKLAETLKAFDFDVKSMVEFQKEEIIGRQVVVNILTETYNGQDRSSIKKVDRHPAGPIRKNPGAPF